MVKDQVQGSSVGLLKKRHRGCSAVAVIFEVMNTNNTIAVKYCALFLYFVCTVVDFVCIVVDFARFCSSSFLFCSLSFTGHILPRVFRFCSLSFLSFCVCVVLLLHLVSFSVRNLLLRVDPDFFSRPLMVCKTQGCTRPTTGRAVFCKTCSNHRNHRSRQAKRAAARAARLCTCGKST